MENKRERLTFVLSGGWPGAFPAQKNCVINQIKKSKNFFEWLS